MIVNKSYEINSCDDVELGIKRESKLGFKLCFDDEKEIKALVFIIPGLGVDNNENYRDNLAQFVASEFKTAVVSVNYHCIGNRSLTGASHYLDEIDKLILKESIKVLGIKLNVEKINTFPQIMKSLNFINNEVQKLKENWEISSNFRLNLHVSIKPTKNEYQNFGVMQAQDIINTLLFIKKNPPFNSKLGGGIPVILIGSSHGGYVAYMSAKIAPYLIDGVIDNSSYAKFPLRLVGFGKEIDFTKYFGCANTDLKHLRICCSDKTYWTINKESPNFFSTARKMIRYILEPNHLEIQAKYPKPLYVGYHSMYDDINLAPPDEKIELYEYFKKLNFDAKLTMIKDASQIDGKLIKNLEHGMGMSIKTLIQKELPLMLEKISKNKKNEFEKSNSISYPCDDLLYTFTQKNDKINLKITKVKNASE